MSEEDVPHLTFYGDASSKDRDYMVAGGFAIPGSLVHKVETDIAQLREDYGIRSEFHWKEYRGGRRKEAYEKLVSYGFDLVKQKQIALHVLISPFKGYDHKAKKGENRDTSVNRMYFQLCLHRLARFYGRDRAIHIRLDAGNDSADICSMRHQVCAIAYKHHRTRPNCIRSIEPINSQKSGAIQLADIIVGAISAKQNNIIHTSPKGALADFVLKESGKSTWEKSTPAKERIFTVWHFQGKK